MKQSHIPDGAKDGALAAGGLLAAIGASSCCVLPLTLAFAGVGGAWIGALTALAPCQPVFLALGVISVGLGLWRIYGRWQPAGDGLHSGTLPSRRWSPVALWLAAGLLLIDATNDWWIPLAA